MALFLRHDFDAARLRSVARKSIDADQVRRFAGAGVPRAAWASLRLILTRMVLEAVRTCGSQAAT